MKDYPAIKLALFFMLGIILQYLFNISFTTLIILSTTLLLILLILYFTKFKSHLAITGLLIFTTGALSLASSNNYKAFYPFQEKIIKKAQIFGEVEECGLFNHEKVNFTLKADSVYYADQVIKYNFRIRVTLREKSKKRLEYFHDKIKIGNYISINANIREPRDARNPGEFDYKKYLLGSNIIAVASCNNVEKIQLVREDVNEFDQFIFNCRKHIAEVIDKHHEQQTAGFLKGLLLADRSEIDENLKEKFINAGVVHVLAVSGLHVGYIVLIFVFLFARFNLKIRVILTIIGLLFFMLLTGAHPSVFRATVMAIVIILSKYSGRQANNYNSLAIASLIILVINPNELFNPGFQLSFSAVLAIISITPILQNKIYSLKLKSKFLNWLLLFFAVSFSAQIGTLPFTLIYFNKLSLLALIANIVIIPLIGFIVGIGIFTIFLSFISSWMTNVYASANDLFVSFAAYFTEIIGDLSFSHIYISEFSFYDIILFYLLLVLLYWLYPKMQTLKAKYIFVILMFVNSYVFFALDNEELFNANELSIVSIDIGQGDAFFLKFPNGKTAMVDAGNATQYFDNGTKIIYPLLKRNGIEKIDYSFISHVDADHYKGIYSLVEMGIIDTLYKPEIDTTLKKDIRFEKFLNNYNVPVKYYKKGIKDIGNCRLYILNELENPDYQNLDVNNKSGIIKLVHGKNSFLFIGDAEAEMEEILCDSYGDFLKCDVLKVSHHGSKTGSSEEFIEMVNPNIGIISAGIGNKFGHPAEEIIDRLIRYKIKIRRTDKEGAIIISSDGYKITENDWRN